MRGPIRARGGLLVVLALFVALPLLAPPGARPAAAGSRYLRKVTKVAPGMTLERITDRRGPNRIRVLRLDPSSKLTLDVALATGEIPGHERPSSMAARHGAIAAINGDFTLRPSQTGAGRPVNIFAEDGELVTSPLIWGRNFAISHNERNVFIGHPKFSVYVQQTDSGESLRVRDWNSWPPAPGDVGGYTPSGGSAFRPPAGMCSARLGSVGGRTWGAYEMAVEGRYVVDRVRCGGTRMARRGGVVLSTPVGTEQAAIFQESLSEGETLVLGWSTEWPGVLDTIGGNPTVLEDGQVSIGGCYSSSFCGRNPRTGIGVTPAGTILLVTVDGRSPGYSVGMTLDGFAALFRYLGADWALNLDGGGSTAMVVRGRLVNRPSDGWERAVGSALLILSGADRGEVPPDSTPVPSPSPTSIVPPLPDPITSAAAPEAPGGCVSLRDAGSTGGLLDALARGEMGGRRDALAPELQDAVEVFRGRRACR
ncbi:MAG: phosphodiester glycosidase family protein [Actinomycetota bacterium]